MKQEKNNLSFEEKVLSFYEELAKDTDNAWEVLSGEKAKILAEEMGIPGEKWGEDRVRMLNGRSYILEEIKQGIPDKEDQEERIRARIGSILDSYLQKQGDETAQRKLLTSILVLSGRDERSYRFLTLEQLRNEVIDQAIEWSKDAIVRQMICDCQEIEKEEELTDKPKCNAGALVTATYLSMQEGQDVPEVIGCAGAVADVSEHGDNTLEALGYILLAIAGALAIILLIFAASGVITGGGAHLVVKETVSGVGTAIAEEMGLWESGMKVMLKVVVGCGTAGTLIMILKDYLIPSKENNSYVPISTSQENMNYVDVSTKENNSPNKW